ncbi:MAG: GNAT family N-acetyltransferase [Acinetobacter sp.]
MQYVLERVGIDDAEQYRQLVFDAYQQIRDLNLNFDAAHIDLEKAQWHLSQHLVYGYYENQKLIGTVTLRTPWSLLPGPFQLPHLGNFAVHPNFQGKGLSRKILQQLEQQILLEQFNVPAYSLGTASNHPWLIEMYERWGFRAVLEKDLGKGHITVFMVKVLDNARFNEWNSKFEVIQNEK